MKITGNYYSYVPQRTTFGTNKGVLRAIEKLKDDKNEENVEELQAQAKTAKLTSDFLAEIEKVTPEDIKSLAKKSLGLIPW